MLNFGADRVKDEALLAARILLMGLFLIFGWQKLTHFGATIGYFTQEGVPMPPLATVIAVVMELFAGLLILVGFLTRPVALLVAVYTLATAFLGHPYWTMTGMAHLANMINFYKNISIIGGLLALYVAGPGRYALDARRGG